MKTISIEKWESLQETLFWLTQKNTLSAVTEARADLAAGRTISAEKIKETLGITPQK